MKLDAWLEQDHSLDERLRLIECLCQAVNEVHDQGEALGALEPGRIEVSPGSRCDLSAAGKGSASPAYAAPDGEAGVPTAAADVYAAGVIAWEVLAGQSVGRPPRHLAEVRPGLATELADAVMACLERSAEWRPKDLTYLAQMAAARQTDAARARDTPPMPLPPRAIPRTSSRRPSRRTWPLLAALVVLLGIAAFQWKDYLGIGGASEEGMPPKTAAPPIATPTPVAPAPAPTSPPVAEQPTTASTTAATGEGPTGPAATAADTAPPASQPSESGSAGRPETAPVLPPAPLPPPAPVTPPARVVPSEPAPATEPAAPPPAAVAEPTAAGPESTDTRPPDPPTTTAPAPPETAAGRQPPPETENRAAPPAPAAAPEPAVLDAVSPLEVKRPGSVLLDLRGKGLQPRHRVRVLPVKRVPWGIKIVRERHVSDTLITILVELSEDVEPGDYAFAVEDGLGSRSDPVVFKVTK